MTPKVVALIGSYRKGGTIDETVKAILEGAREKGAQVRTIYLVDKHLEFCRNCRKCCQNPGPSRGKCLIDDDLESILTEIEEADALVLGSPVNHSNVTAITRLFLERLTGYVYWPWGQAAPNPRSRVVSRKAVLVASCAMPAGFFIPLLSGAARALRTTATMLGAKSVGNIWVGMASQQPHCVLSARLRARAHSLGMRLF